MLMIMMLKVVRLVVTMRLGRILCKDFVSGSTSIGHCRDPLHLIQEIKKFLQFFLVHFDLRASLRPIAAHLMLMSEALLRLFRRYGKSSKIILLLFNINVDHLYHISVVAVDYNYLALMI